MASFDAAVSDTDARLAAHQYNQLLHLLSTADRSTFPSPADAARRVFSHMLQVGAAPSEATITSLARVTASDAADHVATMREKYGLAPRLRSYSPVLAAFRRAGDAAKAYAVEAHMAASGVSPEEPELAALLDVSSTAGYADKVYEYMHKLRQAVDCVNEETAQVVEAWFRTHKAAMAAGMTDWNAAQVKDAIVVNGGGCAIGLDGLEVDWLELHKEYQAIVDGANIALYQQNFAEGGFSLTQTSISVLLAISVSDITFNFILVITLFVKYTFNKGKALLMMPPPYSSEIQESELGSWHVSLEEKSGDERIRIWLCIGRTGTCKEPDEAPAVNGAVPEVPPTEVSEEVQQRLLENKAELAVGKRKGRD
ncbi:hypothetical protein PR202_gb03625 [Eleusine coracana subsp. coracana]|uniref:PROP1-like PPR domain-containing protein n=1 Tax=Eleusine coracana subsp. coracana TaxID=191504 RepID=A0AAV5E255_ELECO|nr:hypothetical protein PR202_gb03625 [Eleusine coracana subsp. coracana]